MKKNILTILSVLLVNGALMAQGVEWVRTMGGVGIGNGSGHSLALDQEGNIYTTGYFYEHMDFDPGPIVYNLYSEGLSDIFIQKLDKNGDLVWVKSMGGGYEDYGATINTDTSGNVYTTGTYKAIANFNLQGAGGQQVLTSNGATDVFIHKMDSDGNFIWVKSIGGIHYDYAHQSIVDQNGNIFIVGAFRETVDFDPGVGVTNITANGFEDIFVLKLDQDGNFLWVKTFGSTDPDFGDAITIDQQGNILMTGSFKETVDFDPGPGIENMTTTGVQEMFVLKLDSNGDFVWVKAMGGITGGAPRAIQTDLQGNVYTAGLFYLTIDFDPSVGVENRTSAGGNDMFLQKLNSNGDFEWVNTLGSTSNDMANSLYVDNNGSLFMCGTFNYSVDFDTGAGTEIHTADLGSNGDIFIEKLDLNGNLIWVKTIGGPGSQTANCIKVDSAENVYTTGSYTDQTDFDPDTGQILYTPFGNTSDIFVHKIGPCLNSSVSLNASGLTANANGMSYQWLNCNGYTEIIGANGQNFTPTANGSYAVIVDNGTCSDTSACLTIGTIGLEELNEENLIQVFPNPANTWIQISSKTQLSSIEIMDISGKVVLQCDFTHELSIVSLSPGLYIVKVFKDKQLIDSQKVVKQ